MVKQAKKIIKVKPIYIRKLAERMSHKDIAKAIGYTPSGVSTLLQGTEPCRKVVEIAAKRIYLERFGKGKTGQGIEDTEQQDLTIVIRCPSDKANMVKDMCKIMGIQSTSID